MGVKLIEVALPLDEINKASAREKSIRHGHPSTLHLWWARRPLAAARAVLFASIVDDPSSPDYRWRDGLTIARTEEAIDAERQRLHDLIVELVQWEKSNDETVLNKVKAEIMRATDGNPPPVLDPFAGGGSIPLEAQRLGLEAHASDLNPVAVLINKALIEIPPKFAGMPPVNPVDRAKGMGAKWKGAAGLAADVRHYGQWMRDEAEKRIGHLYPKATLPDGSEATVIAWLWARTVTCPNPACGAQMPLVSSYWLSKKSGSKTWIAPKVDVEQKIVDFTVVTGNGEPEDPPKMGRGARFRCLICGEASPEQHIKNEGAAGRMGAQLMAIVAEGSRGRTYLPPTKAMEYVANSASDIERWKPDSQLPNDPRNFWTPPYGLTTFGDLFTDRQLVALTTFSDLVGEARERVLADIESGDITNFNGATDVAMAYAEAIATYLAFVVDRIADRGSTIAGWDSSATLLRNSFGRQALPMTWDYAEANPFSSSTGCFSNALDWVREVIEDLPPGISGLVQQADATRLALQPGSQLISTDPPYYDNIGYADLSDFFFVWLRRALSSIYPDLFRTLLVPKQEELVATPYRFKGGKREAEKFFEDGLVSTFENIRTGQDSDFPFTVFYAYKQAEEESSEGMLGATSSTGWDTMLEGLIRSGFSVTATWPMRTEMSNRVIGSGTNALASSIILACRVRDENAPTISRNEFQRRLRRELPTSLRTMQQSSIAPVDLAQAAIGPGMKIYSEYSGVLEPNGEKMRVRTALQLINQVLDQTLSEQDSDYDRETGWAITWFEQYQMKEAEFGRADDLARARNTSVEGLVTAGIVKSGRGKVQLIARKDMPDDWNPERDKRSTDWEAAQHLIKALETDGQAAAARLKRQLGSRADIAKELAYRLYVICERKGWSAEALAYNGLVVSWPEIERQERDLPGTVRQTSF